jgi:mono/diheme cytochrome c family protein
MTSKCLQREYARMSIAILSVLAILLFHTAQAQKKPWIVPKEFVNMSSPVVPSDSILKAGKVLYLSNCTPCHGRKGNGEGPANASLSPYPANHTAISMLKETDGTLFFKLTEGRSPMPGYKTTLTDNERWELVAYIRTLVKVSNK